MENRTDWGDLLDEPAPADPEQGEP
jgi:hypothetical protein